MARFTGLNLKCEKIVKINREGYRSCLVVGRHKVFMTESCARLLIFCWTHLFIRSFPARELHAVIRFRRGINMCVNRICKFPLSVNSVVAEIIQFIYQIVIWIVISRLLLFSFIFFKRAKKLCSFAMRSRATWGSACMSVPKSLAHVRPPRATGMGTWLMSSSHC